jgi:two-component system LytT family response regulator
MKIRAMIVDDEPLARERIRQLLDDEHDITIVAECSNGLEAIALLERRRVDLMFLDVQMPELDGFGVLEALDLHNTPAVIFVTAYDKFALRAFEVHGLDYLLKPIDRSRFAQSLLRARKENLHPREMKMNKHLLALLDDLRVQHRFLERLVIKTRRRVFFVLVSEINYVITQGNYLKIIVHGKSHLLRSTMSRLESKLDPKQFIRIHRSTLVNVGQLQELQPYRKDEVLAIMKDGKRLSVSRRFHKRIMALINNLS